MPPLRSSSQPLRQRIFCIFFIGLVQSAPGLFFLTPRSWCSGPAWTVFLGLYALLVWVVGRRTPLAARRATYAGAPPACNPPKPAVNCIASFRIASICFIRDASPPLTGKFFSPFLFFYRHFFSTDVVPCFFPRLSPPGPTPICPPLLWPTPFTAV